MTKKPAGAGKTAPLLGQTAGVHVANRQRLALSAQMRQKLHLLHLPAFELIRFIGGEMERNPLLASLPRQNSNGQDSAIFDLIDKQAANRSPTLHEHLSEQIIFSFRNAQERHIAFTLSDELNEAGYFSGDLASLARELDVEPNFIEAIFSKLQNFDPPGIFARSLSECLRLQLERQELFDPVFAKLLQGLSLLAQHDLPRLARMSAITQDELTCRLALIKKLNPKPGLAFGSAHEQDSPPLIADAFIEILKDGEWYVTLNEAMLPKLILNQNYSSPVRGTKEERQFIKIWAGEAHQLIHALEARAQTLLKVINATLEVQKDFLSQGSISLKPLTLKQIARATNLHESTISRSIAHKYVTIRQDGINQATYALRHFFSGKLQPRKGAEPYAAAAIRARLAQLISGESIPLSDEKLAQCLREQGVAIARRTVTKYREKLHIAPSHLRLPKQNIVSAPLRADKVEHEKDKQ